MANKANGKYNIEETINMVAPSQSNHNDLFSKKFINLAEKRLGTKVLFANDDFFAEKENLIETGRGIFIPDKYTDRGKWMDGWESRRRRTPGYDYCIIKLGLPGTIHGLDIDTNHFLGNHPPFASVDACETNQEEPGEDAVWTEILPKSPLNPGSQNLFPVNSYERWTHVRLNIYPDGGVARFRVYGLVAVDWDNVADNIDLIAVENGGKVVTCNDMFFSSKDNLIMPGRGVNMGDGWETKRKRVPGHDWAIIALGKEGTINKIEVDTAHFKGNFPDRCSIEGACLSSNENDFANVSWLPILPETKLSADHQHYFENLADIGSVTHLRLCIYPDGGVSRLRTWGKIVDKLQKFNQASTEEAKEMLLKCCHSQKWADLLLNSREFKTRKEIYAKAKEVENQLQKEDWLEAFQAHPQIGDIKTLQKKFASTKGWSSEEQSGVEDTSLSVLEELADYNKKYFEKFNYIFIVCATGKSASEMLDILKSRIDNNAEEELKIAAQEQSKITKIRLEKML